MRSKSVRRNPEGRLTISHGGSHFGARAQLVASTGQRLIIAVVANMSGAKVGAVVNEIGRRFGAIARRPAY